MNTTYKLKTLAAAVVLLSGSQSAWALTPWQADGSASGYPGVTGFGTPDYIIYTSGGAAQDAAIDQVVKDTLAAPGTLDIYHDAQTSSQAPASQGSQFTGYYFIGSTNLPANFQGKKVYFGKRSRGAAGYGVVPVLAGTAIDQLDIFLTPTHNTTGLTSGSWYQNSDGTYGQVIGSGAGQTVALTQHFSHGGFLGVDSEALLLNSSSLNYPTPTTEYSTNANTSPWATTWQPTDLSALTRIPTGGLVYGIAVTADLYKVLQAAQIASGQLPATQSDGTATQGDYTHAGSLPSLSRDFVASLLAGKVGSWSDVQVNVGGSAEPLTSFASAASVTAPADLAVAVGLRNNGAAVGAAAYATFLNYPYAESSFTPPSPTGSLAYKTAAPIIVDATGVNNTTALLTDFQAGSNSSKLNLDSKNHWGIAIQTATANDGAPIKSGATTIAASGANWRFVKIDGFAPTVENVAAGSYPFWAEGEVNIQANGWTGDGVGPTSNPVSSDIIGFLTTFANDLGSLHIAAEVNPALAQPWGFPGIFTTTQLSGTPASIPYSTATPVVGLTHLGKDGLTHLGIRPYNYSSSDPIELK